MTRLTRVKKDVCIANVMNDRGKLDMHMQKNEIRPLSYITYKS